MNLYLSFILAALTFFVSTTNATADETKRGDISGAVTLDGEPLEAGTIAFHADNGQFFGCKIKDGKLKIEGAPIGRMMVTIEGESVPDKYGSAESTHLVTEIFEDYNAMDFAITK